MYVGIIYVFSCCSLRLFRFLELVSDPVTRSELVVGSVNAFAHSLNQPTEDNRTTLTTQHNIPET